MARNSVPAPKTPPDEADENGELPDGWAEIQLEHLVEVPKADIVDGPFGSNLKSSEYVNEGVPIIRIQNVERYKFAYKDIKFVTQTKSLDLARHSFKSEDIVITKLGAPLGRACIVPEKLQSGIIVADIVRVRACRSRCDNEYVMYAINSPAVQKQLIDETKGTTRPRVNLDTVRKLRLSLPPLPEQKRIVAKVEALLARVNAARERLAKVPPILKRFRQSVLAAACSGRLTEDWRENSIDGDGELPNNWSSKRVAELASTLPRSIQSGPFGSNLKHNEFQEKGILAIGIDNVLNGDFSLGRQHRISEAKFRELEKYAARPLDVLMTVMATVGRCCVVPIDIERAIITKHVYRITVNQELISPFYLLHAFRGALPVLEHVKEGIRGQTRPGINGVILKEAPIPLPPIAEQREIVRRVEKLFKLADAIEKRVAAATLRADRLTQAILAKAFRGELVPTEAELARRENRPYESAAELLKRIQSERAKDASAKKKRTRANG